MAGYGKIHDQPAAGAMYDAQPAPPYAAAGSGYGGQQQYGQAPYAQQPYAQPYAPQQPYAQPYAQQPYAQGYPPPHQQQQQSYAIHPSFASNAQPPSHPPPPMQGGSSSDKINKEPKYKDLWAAILFGVCFAGFVVCAYFGIRDLKFADANEGSGDAPKKDGEFVVPPAKDIGGIMGATIGAGFVLSALYFVLMQKFAGKLIKVSLVFQIAVLIALAVYYFYIGATVAGIIWVVFAGLLAFFFWSWRDRIPFAKLMLKTVTKITRQFPATLLVGFIGLVVETAFSALWLATFAGLMQHFDDKQSGSGVRYVAIVFMLFIFYWVTCVIGNVVHVTTSGLFAAYYFTGTVSGPGGKVSIPSRNPTAQSAKRALTTSFGSICFGSLIIALLQTIRALLRSAASQAADDGNIGAALCAACAQCCLGWIEAIIEYFNKWAFVQVAIYGKDYITAAKDTWRLCKSRGIDAIINDSLVATVLSMGSLLVGFICGFIAYLYVHFSDNIPSETLHYVVFCLLGVFFGVAEFAVLANVIDSGVTTTFVCLAEDPAALYRTKPEVYEKIREVYPEVMLAV
ncbi:plasma-membrane choline transporter-domain-containing protein [Gaertneriomyces semiglobifer]|nr:plasma-membrane choline transporter-domain-containing protein [Gaertneriomyces semiglobifer]